MSRSTRSALVLSAISLFALATGCERQDGNGYCDDSGCYGCSDQTHLNCWPLPHDSCNGQMVCQGGQICTSIGCCNPCKANSDCRKGETCTGEGYCAPDGVQTTPIDQAATPNNNPNSNPNTDPNNMLCGIAPTLCAADADCGASRACRGGMCHAACASSSSCPVGQGCVSGVCVDQAPQVAQCLWDFDCGPASRCINATCHPLCGTNTQCAAGELCDSGVCRADVRPAR
jgi:hypothetical protein